MLALKRLNQDLERAQLEAINQEASIASLENAITEKNLALERAQLQATNQEAAIASLKMASTENRAQLEVGNQDTAIETGASPEEDLARAIIEKN